MKYIALEELQKYIIHDGCDEGCGYIDERDIAAIPTVDFDKIRAEIDREYKWLVSTRYTIRDVDIAFGGIFQIIDKYKESEVQDADSN